MTVRNIYTGTYIEKNQKKGEAAEKSERSSDKVIAISYQATDTERFRELKKMICPKCSAKIENGLYNCPFCGCKLPRPVKVKPQAYPTDADRLSQTKEYSFAEEIKKHTPEEMETKKPKNVEAGIYKVICVALALCLVAGSVVWASLFLRDRIDRQVVPVQNVSDENQAAPNDEAEKTPAQTTSPPVTSTTTTTTTADPFTLAVDPKYTDDYGTLYSLADALAIRIGPGYDYSKLDNAIPSGSALKISAEQVDARSGETWCYIDYEGNVGWVCKSYLTDKNPTKAVVLPDELYEAADVEEYTVIRYGGLKLYSGPGDDYDVLDTIPEDEKIEKLGHNYFAVKWIYTEYNGQAGWVASYEGDWFNPTIE